MFVPLNYSVTHFLRIIIPAWFLHLVTHFEVKQHAGLSILAVATLHIFICAHLLREPAGSPEVSESACISRGRAASC